MGISAEAATSLVSMLDTVLEYLTYPRVIGGVKVGDILVLSPVHIFL